ncbi:MAG: hypothetical protein ACI4S3_05845 [Candidatus Gastranaerophilaceae bacterium]
MKFVNFFKTLNKKIDKLEKMTSQTNPFLNPTSITLVWVDEECPLKTKFDTEPNN